MALVYRQPRHPACEQWGARALELSRRAGDERLKALTLSNYAFHKLNAGSLEEAANAIEACRRFAESDDAAPLSVLTMKWVEAMYLTYTAGHTACMKVVRSGLELSASTGVVIMDFLLLGQGALSALDAGDAASAHRFFKRMTYLSGRDPLTGKGYYQFILAYKALLNGAFRQAAVHADTALQQASDTGFPLAEAFCQLEYAHVLRELKERAQAVRRLKEAQKLAKLTGYKYMNYACLLTEALFAFDIGKEKAGLAALRKGLALGRSCGFINTYTLHPELAAGLCARALQAGIETEYAQTLIKKRKLQPETPPLDIEAWPWPVKVYTLGRFSLVKDGRPVKFTRKARQKPITLLKALITLGGREVAEEKLTDFLWPGAEGDSSHKAFAITLHRLRGLLGLDKAITFSNGRLTLEARYCWVDTWAFERVLGKADEAVKEGKTETAISFMERAVALYHGPCCADDASFADAFRERLKRKFVKYARKLGRLHEEGGEFDKAIDLYEKGLGAEPFAEEFYQRLVVCHQNLGHPAEAEAVYHRLQKAFARHELEPSQTTEDIYKALTAR